MFIVAMMLIPYPQYAGYGAILGGLLGLG